MKKLAVVATECVACGSCLKVCPMNAIKIHKGIKAIIDSNKCVGCGKCCKTCPAEVITLTEREVVL